MKKILIYINRIFLVFILALIFTFFIPVNFISATEKSSIDINDQDVLKVSTGINMAKAEEYYTIGTNPYRIFDVRNEDFKQLFINARISDYKVFSISGNSKEEFAENYSNNRKVGSSVSAEVPLYNVPIDKVGANISGNFELNISSSLSTINEEYYHYLERYQQTRIITTDWLSKDLTQYFSSDFINALEDVNSIHSAIAFLEMYGTHVFDKYYIGGSLIITNYIVSEVSISEEYEKAGVGMDLGAAVSSAANTCAQGSTATIETINVSNSQTQSKMSMRALGGDNFNALTVNDLFTWKQEFFTGGGSGFIYSEWIKSFNDEDCKEVVVYTEKPIPVWELLHKSEYYDPVKDFYFQEAFDLMCYDNYSHFCEDIGVDAQIIGKINYESNGNTVEFNITNTTIKLPSDVVAEFSIGESIISNDDQDEVVLELNQEYDYARLENNQLYILPNSSDKSIVLNVLLHDEVIYTLHIAITNNNPIYSNGYGTKDQPYCISTPQEWNSFISEPENYDKKYYYMLSNDIDLLGKIYEPGGAFKREGFKGVLDGGNHTLYNFSIISKNDGKDIWNNIGLFGINYGVIENLRLENVVCLNSGIFKADNSNVNIGVLVGENKGVLNNIIIDDCSLRVSGQLNNSELNAGLLVGNSIGTISNIGVTNSNILGQLWKGSGTLNVGGIIGHSSGKITNCYINKSSINSFCHKPENSKYSLGGIIGSYTTEELENSYMSYCVAQNNIFSNMNNSFGYIAGYAKNTYFTSCVFEGSGEKAVNCSSMSGCTAFQSLKLNNINSAEFNNNWTTDSNGNIILKIHAK